MCSFGLIAIGDHSTPPFAPGNIRAPSFVGLGALPVLSQVAPGELRALLPGARAPEVGR